MIVGAMSLTAALGFVSCNNANKPVDDQPATPAESQQGALRVAYVEVDSIMSQYEFCKEYSLILEKKGNNARNTINTKGKTLQAAAASFQQKMQNNGFTSREQAESQQAAIQRQQQDLQELQARLAGELDQETAKFNKALHDSIHNFLATYNKDKKYDLILSRQGDNILIGSKRLDITVDVVNGLNKRYKKTKKN